LGIAPNQSIVIDDNPYFLKMAEKSGGNVIQACLTEDYLPQFQYIFKRMKDLPEIIAKVKEENFI
jgi:FMN phosphatase YigB (HAD superfamily)